MIGRVAVQTAKRRWFSYAVRTSMLAIAYAIAAKWGLTVSYLPGVVTMIWPPSGIALAAFLYYGYEMWLGVALGMVLTATVVDATLMLDLAPTLGNVVEAAAGTYMLRRVKFDLGIGSVRDVLIFVVLGAVSTAAVGATVGALGLALSSNTSGDVLGSAWMVWWLGDAMGILIITPFILAWINPVTGKAFSRERIGEGILLLVAVIGVSISVFVAPSVSHAARYPLAYLLSPILLWAAFRFQHRGATSAIIIVVALALWGTTQGAGPLAGSSLQESLMLLWAFMAVVAITTLLITALIAEKHRAHTERAELQRELQQSQKMEAIGQLTGGIAHDFNNILASVQGFSELAQEKLSVRYDAERDHTLARYLSEVRNAAHRAGDLVGQLLSFSRQGSSSDSCFDAVPLVRESLRILRPALPATVEIRTHLPDSRHLIATDGVKFQQLVMNLCLNARDAMGGKGVIEIRVRGVHVESDVCSACRKAITGEFVELSIADTGPGIADDILDRVFEPFFTTKEVGKGSGMGLAMVHGIVHGGGGHILVESSTDHGTRMRLLLRRSEHDQLTSPSAPQKVRAIEPPVGKILVVDDENAVRCYLKELLESRGFDVIARCDPSSALATFASDDSTINAVVTDQTMPGMTGLEMAEKMLALRPTIPIIICSGYHDALISTDVTEHGIHGVCAKPIDSAELLRMLGTALTRE